MIASFLSKRRANSPKMSAIRRSTRETLGCGHRASPVVLSLQCRSQIRMLHPQQSLAPPLLLFEAGWFGEQPSSAELRRDGEQYVGCLVVVDEAWNDEEVRKAARRVQEHLRQGAFNGQRFRIELCDASLEVHGRL